MHLLQSYSPIYSLPLCFIALAKKALCAYNVPAMKTITVLGSTGSIGRQTLEVAEHLGYKVIALTANNNESLLEEQARRFGVSRVALAAGPGGFEAVCDIAEHSGADIVVTAIAGEAGLEPTLGALRTGKRVALANKEPLVCAGECVIETAQRHGTEIVPVDSEHSAIFQCLAEVRDINRLQSLASRGSVKISPAGDVPAMTKETSANYIKKIILTASGGPFRGFSKEQLGRVTPEDALKHPNWNMGAKITIDSATMMNKGLELIEAMHLFGVSPGQIEVVVHPESIVHSMVEFTDGSTVAQLSNPDMRMPIQYALTYPGRVPGLTRPLDLTALGSLTFEKPDMEAFPCLRLAYEAAQLGSGACAAMNRANEEAVALFLEGKIGFTDIAMVVNNALEDYR